MRSSKHSIFQQIFLQESSVDFSFYRTLSVKSHHKGTTWSNSSSLPHVEASSKLGWASKLPWPDMARNCFVTVASEGMFLLLKVVFLPRKGSIRKHSSLNKTKTAICESKLRPLRVATTQYCKSAYLRSLRAHFGCQTGKHGPTIDPPLVFLFHENKANSRAFVQGLPNSNWPQGHK